MLGHEAFHLSVQAKTLPSFLLVSPPWSPFLYGEMVCNAFLYFALSTQLNFVVRWTVKCLASLQVDQRHIDGFRARLLDAIQHRAGRFESVLLIVVWIDAECDVQGLGSDDSREE